MIIIFIIVIFRSQAQSGVLGLAPGDANRPTFMSQLLGSRQRAGAGDARSFSLCLRGSGGRLVFGGAAGGGERLPLQTHGPRGKYTLEVRGLLVGGARVRGGLGQAQLDSASTLTYFPPDTYRKLRAAIEGFCRRQADGCGGGPGALPPSEGRDGEECWRRSGSQPVGTKGFPDIAWEMAAGVELLWPARGYLLRQGSAPERWCYAFAPTEPLPDGSRVVLGASWMVDRELTFDVAAGRLAVAPAT